MMRRSSTLRFSSILVSVSALAIGCADSHTPEESGEPVAEAVQNQAHAQPTCVDHAGPGMLAMRWTDGDKEAVATDKEVSIVLKNPSPDSIAFSAFATASGPGRKERRIALGSHTLAPGEEKPLAINVHALPIQSTELSAELRVEAELVDAEGVARKIGSQPVWYHFARDRKSAVVYGAEVMAREFGGGVLNGNAFGAAAKVKNDDGTWEDVQAMAGDAKDPDFQQGPTALVEGVPQAVPELASSQPGAASPMGIQLYGNYRVCTVWRSAFIDSGYGEDYATESGIQSVAASHSYAWVETSGGSTVWSGYLDVNGCTPVLSLGGSYYLNTKPVVLSGTSRIDVITGIAGGEPGTYMYLHTPFSVSGLTWPPGSTATKTVTPSIYGGPFQNSAAVASRVMAMPDNGLAPNTTIRLRMAEGCPYQDPWFSCSSGQDVYIGTTAPTGETDSNSKIVITHEVGHAAQYNAMGRLNNDYSADVNDGVNLFCSCLHVTDPNTNGLHCLQSREYISAAEVEGYAQFFAAKAWNNQAEANCSFAYYKQFRVRSGDFWIVKQPPVQRDCGSNPKWMENYCASGETDRGVEWDWQNFLWNLNTQGPDKVTTSEVYGIYRSPSVCNGNCNYNQVHWPDFRAGAQSQLGLGSPKLLHLLTAGDQAGVDH